jgi:hypothetical protein
MPLPDVNVSILDGALGIVGPSSAKVQLKIGPAPLGAPQVLQSVADLTSLTSTFGKGGPLVEAAALALQSGGPVYCMNVNPSVDGSVPAPVKVGTSNGTLSIAARPFQTFYVKITFGNAAGTARYQLSVDGGASYGAERTTSTVATIQPEAPFLKLAFTGTLSTDFAAGDVWTIFTDGTSTRTTGTGTGTVTPTAQPLDSYAIQVKTLTAGALGAATFAYSLDGGNNWSGSLLIPASGKYVVPDTGILFTFAAGPFNAGESWTCSVTAPGCSSSDVTACLTAALADPRTWGFVHVIGAPSSPANAAALLATIQSQLVTAESQFRYARALIEVPQDTDANIVAAFASAATLRVGAAAGYASTVSPLNGRILSRSAAWVIAARASDVPISEDLGRVASGPVPGIVKLVRDEAATPGLDAARFCTLRSIIGRQGTYVTTGRLMAPNGSDYSLWQNGRVMDEACNITRNALLKYLNSSLRLNADGTIEEREARSIETYVDTALRAGLTQPGDASDVSVVVSRTANVLSTQILPVSVRVRPLGYAKWINVDIGFAAPQKAA